MRRDVVPIALADLGACGTAWGEECAQTIKANDLLGYNAQQIRVGAACDVPKGT